MGPSDPDSGAAEVLAAPAGGDPPAPPAVAGAPPAASPAAAAEHAGPGPAPAAQKSLTIGAVCKALQQEFPDISISKIRYLEDQKLLAPRRTPGGYRLYSTTDVSRLRTILRLQRDEFLPLRVIRQELASGRAAEPESVPGTGAAESSVLRPAASSWRITRKGRNSSRCRRRIVRRRETSEVE